MFQHHAGLLCSLRNGEKLATLPAMVASKNGENLAIIPSQVRGARGILDWTMEQLSHASGVPMRTLFRFERGEGAALKRTQAALRAALEAAGGEFIAENGGGAGVRLRAKG